MTPGLRTQTPAGMIPYRDNATGYTIHTTLYPTQVHAIQVHGTMVDGPEMKITGLLESHVHVHTCAC